MERKTYLDALKKVASTKPKENYLVIEVYYNDKIILPYKDGIAFLSTLANAESFKEDYSKAAVISSFNKDHLKTSIMSGEDYARYKIAALLNVTIDEIKEQELMAA